MIHNVMDGNAPLSLPLNRNVLSATKLFAAEKARRLIHFSNRAVP